MNAARRGYVYLATGVSLEAVIWALIGLLRAVLQGAAPSTPEAMAFRMATVVVGLPVFVLHWRWAQRLAGAQREERASGGRRLYLYGMMVLLLVPFLANAFGLLAWLAARAMGAALLAAPVGAVEPDPLRNVAALAVLGPMLWYHWRITSSDRAAVGETGGSATVRRFYVLGLAALGSVLTAVGFMQLSRWALYQVGTMDWQQLGGGTIVAREAARLAVGVPLWLLAWRWVERLADEGDEPERESALRYVYLYGSLFVVLLVGLTSAAMIVAGALRQALGLPLAGNWRDTVTTVVVMAAAWAFFREALRREAGRQAATARQAGIRRLYHYLLAAVALAAVAAGLGGLLTVAWRSLAGTQPAEGLRETLAWGTAALVVGLPVWLPSWRRMQTLAVAESDDGGRERESTVRRLYLYGFLFVASVAVLSSAVFAVARLLMALLGAGRPDALETDLPRSLAYGLVAACLWGYHAWALRQDGRIARSAAAGRERALPTIVLDTGDGALARALASRLAADMPSLPVTAYRLTPDGAVALSGAGGAEGGVGGGGALGAGEELGARPDAGAGGGGAAVPAADPADSPVDIVSVARRLGEARLIVGPWDVAVPAAAAPGLPAATAPGVPAASAPGVPAAVADAVVASPARRLLLPTASPGWDWAGVEPFELDESVAQVATAVRQIADDEPVRPARRLTAGVVVALAIGALALFFVVVVPIVAFMTGRGLGYLLG